jgi:hypothetical protein
MRQLHWQAYAFVKRHLAEQAMEPEKILFQLQDEFAMVDWFTRPGRPAGAFELMLKRHQAIRLRMDANRNHQRPHIHVDYGKDFHSASYAIDNGERLVGLLDRKYDRPVTQWIAAHRDELTQVWTELRLGQPSEAVIAELRGSSFA